MRLPADSEWHYVMSSFVWLRMPLFTVLSGLIYASHRVTKDNLHIFLGKKARRLLLPLVVATFFYYVAYANLRSGPGLSAIATAYVFPYQHLWFLQAILILFLLISVTDAVWHPSVAILALASLVCAALSHFFLFSTPQVFALNKALYLSPFFLFGMVVGVAPGLLRSRAALIAALAAAVTGITVQQASLWGLLPPIQVNHIIASACGVALVFLILVLLRPNRWLAAIGACSLTIYIWHLFATGGSRVLLTALGVHSTFVLFVPGVFLGVLLPILLQRVVSVTPWLSWPIAGLRARGEIPKGRFSPIQQFGSELAPGSARSL